MTDAPDAPMTLRQRIESAMRDAMRQRDSARTTTLRMAMAAAHNRRIELDRGAGRAERADAEEAEAAILSEYLPQQLSASEIEELARAAIAETGATSVADLGQVMGRLSPQTKGRADGRLVSDVVRRLLGG